MVMTSQMNEAMQAERDEVIRTLNEANDLLMKMFNVQTGEDDE
jgi:hypothetical protein